MSAEYSVEELRTAAKSLNENGICPAGEIANAYADLLERIEADESAVPAGIVGEEFRDVGGYNARVSWSGNGDPPPAGTELFTHPPAQSAQVDADETRDTAITDAFDAAENWLTNTARKAGPHGVTADQESMMRLGYVNGYKDAHPHSPDAADSGQSEVQRQVEANGNFSLSESPDLWPEWIHRAIREAVESALAEQGQGESSARCESCNGTGQAYVIAATTPGNFLSPPEAHRELDVCPDCDGSGLTHPAPPASPAGVPDGWSGWAVQYPDRLPKLYGAREIAELNWEAPADLIHVVEVERIVAAPQPGES